MFRFPQLFSFVIGIALVIPCNLVLAQLEQLAIRVPESANALVVINAKAAFESPLAESQDWNPQGLKAHQAGITALPAGAENVLMAAEIDFELMQPLWEIAVAHVNQMPTMKDIATRSSGRTDRLAGVRAVERPNDSFVVALGPKVIGAMSPANRQHVIRWVRKSQNRKNPAISSYLAEAVEVAAEANNHIVLALDLHGILAPAEVAGVLAKEKSLPGGDTADIESLSKIVASIRGIRLEVELANTPQGRLSIDFNEDAATVHKIAKPLLLSVLAAHGASIDDISNWEAHVDGKSVALAGMLSESGLRRVLSVLSSPVGPMASSKEEGGSTNEAIAEASQRYFQSVTHYLDDLFANDFRPQSMFQAKTWLERYARKIGDLDTHQVDQDVVSFGREVSDYLYEIISIVDRTQKRSDLRETFLYEPGRRRFNRYGAFGGYVEKPYVARDRAIAQADEASLGLEQVDAVVRDLRTISAQTRKTMTERYERQF